MIEEVIDAYALYAHTLITGKAATPRGLSPRPTMAVPMVSPFTSLRHSRRVVTYEYAWAIGDDASSFSLPARLKILHALMIIIEPPRRRRPPHSITCRLMPMMMIVLKML